MRTAALALGALLLAGCASPAPGASVETLPREPAAEWTKALTEATYEGVISGLARLAADDGTSLSLTFHLPDGLTEGEKVPTLLQITPYQPLDARKSSSQGTDGPASDWRFFVERGAAYVEADARGTGGSEGCLDFGGAADRADAASFVAWIREQPWSNGVVVTDGVSHPGMGSVVAHTGVPALTAALAHAPVVDYYRDEWYQGAKFESQLNGLAYQAIELAPSAYLDPASLIAQAAPCTGRTTLDFEQPEATHGDLWDERDLARYVPDERIPILLTNGFIDQNVHPDHVQAYWEALPADYPKYVIWGWWYHGWPDMEGHPAKTFEDVRHRWLDATLFNLSNGLWDEPHVLVEDSTGVWHEGNAWPLEPSVNVRLNATPEGDLVAGLAGDGALSYMDRLGATRGKWTDTHVAFRTEPLEDARMVNGAPLVHLVASSDQSETKWVAYLLDEAPDGTWQRITHGYADSHTYESEDTWSAMQPGTAYAWHIRLMPTAVVVEAGHRITLLIASQDQKYSANSDRVTVANPDPSPCWDDHRGGCYLPDGIRPAATAGRATNTVLTGVNGTYVEFAWVDPALTQKAER